MTRLDQALALARQGLLIFPLRPGVKSPYKDDKWKEMMTTDEAQIRRWFDERPGMNYGVCGGEKFFIVDLDYDPERDKDGVRTLEEMQNEQDPCDWITGATLEVKSPRGGRHIYLACDTGVRCSIGSFAYGIDIRGGLAGSEGYVVGPGSALVDNPDAGTLAGDYTIVTDAPIAKAPAWVASRIETTGMMRSESADTPLIEYDLPHALEECRDLIRRQTTWPVQGSYGDAATLHFCLILRDHAVSPETCMELLTEPAYSDGKSWNESCSPPWSDDGLRGKIENAYRYGKNQPGSKGGLLALMDDYGADAADAAAKAARLANFERLVAMTFRGDALTKRPVKREMVVPEWLPAHGMTQVLAKRGTGKTIIILDMSLRIALDMDWHKLPTAPGWTVLYLCGEDDLGVQQMMKGWKKVHGKLPEPDRFILITGVPNLMSGDDVKMWLDYCNEIIGEQRVVTVLDTWQRAASRASQNDDEQMGIAMANAEAFSAGLRGPCVALFHPPKHNEKTISGSQTMENSGVAIWGIGKSDNGTFRRMEVLRMKGKGEGNYKTFSWDDVRLDETDQFGIPEITVVPKQIAGTGEEMSQEAAQWEHSARAYWADIIAAVIFDHHGKRESAGKVTEFNMTNTVDKVLEWIHRPENEEHRKRLRAVQDSSWHNRHGTSRLRKRLDVLFDDNPAPQKTPDGRFIVRCWKVNGKKKVFTADEAETVKTDTSVLDLAEIGEMI